MALISETQTVMWMRLYDVDPDVVLISSFLEMPTTAVIKRGRSSTRYDSVSSSFWKTRSNKAHTSKN